MTLDDDLRSTFAREASTQPAPPPDPDGLIRRGRARRRRRSLELAGAGLAAVLLAGGVTWAVAATDPAAVPDVATRLDATPPAPDVGGRPQLAPGTYRRFVGYSADGTRIEAELTVDGDNWSDGDFPLVGERYGSVFAGVGVYQPRTIAAASGCLDETTTPDLGSTPRSLASRLARLPRSTVLQAPVATRAFGQSAQHLRLRIDVECGSGFYRVAESPTGDRGITYTRPGSDTSVVIDLWVLEVDGTLVVVDQWRNSDASVELVAQTDRTRDSIELVVGG